jgi:hypothetical protein
MSEDTIYMFVVTAEGEHKTFINEEVLLPRKKTALQENSAPMIQNVID